MNTFPPSPAGEAAPPAEADLFHHLRDALKNPAEEPGLPRVLLLGDSISIGYTIPVRRELQGKALVFRPPVNCQFTGYGLDHVRDWLGTARWDCIHFNWGIWDSHMIDARGNLVRNVDENLTEGPLRLRYTPAQYGANLAALADILLATGARLVWASTTPVMSRTGDRFEDIPRLNTLAAAVMRERNIPVNDLYGHVLPRATEWLSPDQVHFNPAGNAGLGRLVAQAIREALLQKRNGVA